MIHQGIASFLCTVVILAQVGSDSILEKLEKQLKQLRSDDPSERKRGSDELRHLSLSELLRLRQLLPPNDREASLILEGHVDKAMSRQRVMHLRPQVEPFCLNVTDSSLGEVASTVLSHFGINRVGVAKELEAKRVSVSLSNVEWVQGVVTVGMAGGATLRLIGDPPTIAFSEDGKGTHGFSGDGSFGVILESDSEKMIDGRWRRAIDACILLPAMTWGVSAKLNGLSVHTHDGKKVEGVLIEEPSKCKRSKGLPSRLVGGSLLLPSDSILGDSVSVSGFFEIELPEEGILEDIPLDLSRKGQEVQSGNTIVRIDCSWDGHTQEVTFKAEFTGFPRQYLHLGLIGSTKEWCADIGDTFVREDVETTLGPGAIRVAECPKFLRVTRVQRTIWTRVQIKPTRLMLRR